MVCYFDLHFELVGHLVGAVFIIIIGVHLFEEVVHSQSLSVTGHFLVRVICHQRLLKLMLVRILLSREDFSLVALTSVTANGSWTSIVKRFFLPCALRIVLKSSIWSSRWIILVSSHPFYSTVLGLWLACE